MSDEVKAPNADPRQVVAELVEGMVAVLKDLPLATARQVVTDEFDKQYVGEAIRLQGSVSRAAVAAGVTRRYIQILKRKALIRAAAQAVATPGEAL